MDFADWFVTQNTLAYPRSVSFILSTSSWHFFFQSLRVLTAKAQRSLFDASLTPSNQRSLFCSETGNVCVSVLPSPPATGPVCSRRLGQIIFSHIFFAKSSNCSSWFLVFSVERKCSSTTLSKVPVSLIVESENFSGRRRLRNSLDENLVFCTFMILTLLLLSTINLCMHQLDLLFILPFLKKKLRKSISRQAIYVFTIPLHHLLSPFQILCMIVSPENSVLIHMCKLCFETCRVESFFVQNGTHCVTKTMPRQPSFLS